MNQYFDMAGYKKDKKTVHQYYQDRDVTMDEIAILFNFVTDYHIRLSNERAAACEHAVERRARAIGYGDLDKHVQQLRKRTSGGPTLFD